MQKVIACVATGLVLGAGVVLGLAERETATTGPLPQAAVTGDAYHDSGEQRPENNDTPKPTKPAPTTAPVTP